jgi:threonine/homoserine/homoserine lactone efflux protein
MVPMMFNPASFNLFLVTCIVLVMTPGPDTLYVLARSLGQGRRAGIISAIGICCGFLVHTAAAAIGLSAILMASSLAFAVVKYAGAGYLIYLGIRTLATRAAAHEVSLAMGMCLVWLCGIAIIAGSARQWLARQRAFWRTQRWFTGGILIFLGIRLLLTGSTADSESPVGY